jgi:hypothetical protein
MSLGLELFALGPRDESQRRIEVLSQFHAISGNTFHQAIWQVPVDQVLVLKQLSTVAIPNAIPSVNVASIVHIVRTPTGVQTGLLGVTDGSTPTPNVLDRAYEDVLIPPGYLLVSVVSFDLANANNASNHGLSGYLVPRGNLVYSQVAATLSST